MAGQDEGTNRPIFDPNTQLQEVWWEEMIMDKLYVICLQRFVQTINDRRNHNAQGYVKFIATFEPETILDNNRIIRKADCSRVILQLPFAALTARWTANCEGASRDFAPQDNLLLHVTRTTKKRLVKTKILNIKQSISLKGEETQ